MNNSVIKVILSIFLVGFLVLFVYSAFNEGGSNKDQRLLETITIECEKRFINYNKCSNFASDVLRQYKNVDSSTPVDITY